MINLKFTELTPLSLFTKFVSISLISIKLFFITTIISDKSIKPSPIFPQDEIISKKLFERFKNNISTGHERIEFLGKLGVDDYINLCGRSSVLLDTLYL